MNPQDKVERVLKEMHIAFSKGMTYGSPAEDKMVIDRREFLDLLDRLTKGIYDMMDQYEMTRQARLNAERSFRRTGDEIIEKANASAEDIYAASVLYTADAIGKIRHLMDQTNDSMNELFIQFRRELREQKDLLRAHESELQSQLADLSDTRKYLNVLRDINREQERKNRDLDAERELGSQYARNMFHAATAAADVTEKSRTLTGSAPAGESPEVTVNRDAAYFKWKAGQDGTDESKEDTGELPAKKVSGPPPITDEPKGENGSEKVFPNEDAIRQAVLEDERRAEMGDTPADRPAAVVGDIIKTVIFGKDQE
ncbi:MAG: hypothetical protein LUC41_06455 [Clostridiales bacterium]|nr:hypothetical protein [Clostridiales bacterium]